jgi:hypothetical protein
MNSRQPRPASEEPELNNERDIPTEDDPQATPDGTDAEASRTPPPGRKAQATGPGGPESVAGEEDPGAALDTEPDAPTTPADGR